MTEDMSSSNLTIRLLRRLDTKLGAFRGEMNEFKRETNQRFDALELRVANVEQTLGGMASHVFFLTEAVKKIDLRLRKVEARLAK